MKSESIIINAIAIKSGGGLTILNSFVNSIPKDKITYVIYINSQLGLDFIDRDNVIFLRIWNKSFFSRLFWDLFGLCFITRIRNFNPIASISLQNTNFYIKRGIPNYLYVHNAIPFFKSVKWRLLKRHERGMWFYQNVYPFWIKFSLNRDTHVFVQSKTMRDLFF